MRDTWLAALFVGVVMLAAALYQGIEQRTAERHTPTIDAPEGVAPEGVWVPVVNAHHEPSGRYAPPLYRVQTATSICFVAINLTNDALSCHPLPSPEVPYAPAHP